MTFGVTYLICVQYMWLPNRHMLLNCIHCCWSDAVANGKALPPNFLLAPADSYVPDIVQASDCVMGKIGYGSVSECLTHNKPLVYVRRDYFNEEPFLRKLLQHHGAVLEIKRSDMLSGNWSAHLERALHLKLAYSWALSSLFHCGLLAQFIIVLSKKTLIQIKVPGK